MNKVETIVYQATITDENKNVRWYRASGDKNQLRSDMHYALQSVWHNDYSTEHGTTPRLSYNLWEAYITVDVPSQAPITYPQAPDPGVNGVYITGFGDGKKINAIKAVREITGLGLKEAKDLVEAASQDNPVFIYDRYKNGFNWAKTKLNKEGRIPWDKIGS